MHDVLPPALVERLDTDPRGSSPPRAAYEMVVALGTALHRCGMASHDLEEQMAEVTHALGVTARFFATPTALFIQLGHGPTSETRLIRVDPAPADLRRTAQVYRVVHALLDDQIDAGQALLRLEAIDAAPGSHGPGVTVIAFAVASAGAARLFQGRLADVCLATLVGAAVGLLSLVAPRLRASVTRLFEPIAAAAAAMLAWLLCSCVSDGQPNVVTLAALVVLLPGLSLTQAMSELAVRNLAAGTARLVGAVTVLMTMAFGVTLGQAIARPLVDTLALSGSAVPWFAMTLPGWTHWLAVCSMAVALLLVLGGDVQDAPLVLVWLTVAMVGKASGAALLGETIAPSLAALILGLGANASGRLLHRPPSIVLIPGLLMLVPGSLGLRSVDAMIAHDPIHGIESAFSTALIAVSLVSGLLVANALVPPVGTAQERARPLPI